MNDAKQNRLLKAKIFYPNMTFALKIFRNQSSTKIRQNSYLFYPRNGIAGHTVFFGFDSVPCFPLSRPSRRGKLLKEKMALVAKMYLYGEMRAARKIDCCWCRLLRLRRVTLERSRIELRSKGQAAATVAERIGATANVLQVPPRTCHIAAKRCNLSNSWSNRVYSWDLRQWEMFVYKVFWLSTESSSSDSWLSKTKIATTLIWNSQKSENHLTSVTSFL